MKYFPKERFCNFNIHYAVLHTLEYFCDCMERLGVTNVELIAGHQGLFIDHNGIQDTRNVRRLLRVHGLKVGAVSAESCGFQYQFAVKGKDYQKNTFNFFSNGIRLAAELGSHILQVNSGWGDWNEPKSEGLMRSAEMHHRLCEVAKEYDVYLACESLRPQESLIGYKLEDIKTLFDMVDHPNFKAMIDTCAMGVAGETLQQWFDVFGSENIIHTHFQDGTPYYHMIWGEGKHNLGQFLKVLYDNNYQGLISQELTMTQYFQDPFAYDKRNVAVFAEHLY